jgi:hypothetical protein
MKKHASFKNLSTGKISAARKKPGSSNAFSYSKNNIFAGKAGGANPTSYPLSKGGSSKLDASRVRSALSLAHNAPKPQAMRKYIATTLKEKGNTEMATLGKKILEKLGKKKKSTYGGNEGDISRSAKKDYAGFKDTDPDYKSKQFGGAHGDERRSARKDYEDAKPTRRKRRMV